MNLQMCLTSSLPRMIRSLIDVKPCCTTASCAVGIKLTHPRAAKKAAVAMMLWGETRKMLHPHATYAGWMLLNLTKW